MARELEGKVWLSGLRARNCEGQEERVPRDGHPELVQILHQLGAGHWPWASTTSLPQMGWQSEGHTGPVQREGSVIDRGLLTEANDQTWTVP